MLDELKSAMLEKGISFDYDSSVCDYIANKGEGAKAGARELRSIIRKEIEDKIVDLIIENTDNPISLIKITAKESIEIISK